MESPHSHPVRWAGWESPFSFAGEETEAQGSRRPGTLEGSKVGQQQVLVPRQGSSRNAALLTPVRGALFSSPTLGDKSCLVWGQSLMGQDRMLSLPRGPALLPG